jgi:DNA-directed RNA polymerase subunit RPC12/RpoP
MTKYKCLECSRTWRSSSGNDEMPVIQDFCPICAAQSIDDLVEEIEKKEGKEKDRRMMDYWKKKKISE